MNIIRQYSPRLSRIIVKYYFLITAILLLFILVCVQGRYEKRCLAICTLFKIINGSIQKINFSNLLTIHEIKYQPQDVFHITCMSLNTQ